MRLGTGRSGTGGHKGMRVGPEPRVTTLPALELMLRTAGTMGIRETRWGSVPVTLVAVSGEITTKLPPISPDAAERSSAWGDGVVSIRMAWRAVG